RCLAALAVSKTALSAVTLVAIGASLAAAGCSARAEDGDGTSAASEEISSYPPYGPFFDYTVLTYFQLQNNFYTDVLFSLNTFQPGHPDAPSGWSWDGNTLNLYRSQVPCPDGRLSFALHQCSPYPNAYSHYVASACVQGAAPVDIGTLGYLCPAPRQRQ